MAGGSFQTFTNKNKTEEHILRHALLTPFAIGLTALFCAGCALTSTREDAQLRASTPAHQLVTIALIMGEPNFSMDGGYQELEEGLYTKPELKPGKKMFAPAQDIIRLLGGEAVLDVASHSARYTLAGVELMLAEGTPVARRNGEEIELDTTPEWRNGSLWVPLESVFRQFGAWPKWDDARQRFSAGFILPASTRIAEQPMGGPVIEANMTEQPAAFYASTEGRQLADVVLAYQNMNGGWPKLDRRQNMLTPVNVAALTGTRAKSTIDNDSTMKQIRVLARAFSAFGEEKYRTGFERGIDYIFAAQLANGGWQQFWPDPSGYKRRITFNDDAIANVLEVMRDIARSAPEFRFVDTARRNRAQTALDRGIALIMKTQLSVGGRKTGWCAQYDEASLEPATGRSYELPSISGQESVNIVRFLMSLDTPNPEIVAAVQDAVAWLDSARISGIARVAKNDPTLEWGLDYVMVTTPGAAPLWARFYDLENGEPLFSARDGVPRKSFSDVSYERRVKYSWYSSVPLQLLEKDYPAWQRRWAADRNVLK